MTIRKTTETAWEHTSAGYGNVDEHLDIEATAEGLEIDCDTIPWQDIDKARAALRKSCEEDATGLCTVRDAVAAMMEYKGDRMEMNFIQDGKRINVELHITSVKDAI